MAVVKIRNYPKPRASSPTDPKEWTITEDGYSFEVGDVLCNYYDGQLVRIASEPDCHGWFETTCADGGRGPGLNSVRVCSLEHPSAAQYVAKHPEELEAFK